MISQSKREKIRQAVLNGVINKSAGGLGVFSFDERLMVVRVLQENKMPVWVELFNEVIADVRKFDGWHMITLNLDTTVPFLEANRALLFTDKQLADAAATVYRAAKYDVSVREYKVGMEKPFEMFARYGIAEATINRGNGGVVIRTKDVVDTDAVKNPQLNKNLINYLIMNGQRPEETTFWLRRIVNDVKEAVLYYLPAREEHENADGDIESSEIVTREHVVPKT